MFLFKKKVNMSKEIDDRIEKTMKEITEKVIEEAFTLRKANCEKYILKVIEQLKGRNSTERIDMLEQNVERHSKYIDFSILQATKPYAGLIGQIDKIKDKEHETLSIELSNVKHVIESILIGVNKMMFQLLKKIYDEYSSSYNIREKTESAIFLAAFAKRLIVNVTMMHNLKFPKNALLPFTDQITVVKDEKLLRVYVVTIVPMLVEQILEDKVNHLGEISKKLEIWENELRDLYDKSINVDPDNNRPTTTFNDSFKQSVLSVSHCINQECVLSHKLATLDSANFGKFYTGKQYPTNLFPRICKHCLLGKFGLYEARVDIQPFANCVGRNVQAADNKNVGPFLKAFKSIENLIDRAKVVFPSNTIILPSGQILMELLMTNPEYLFNVKKKIPIVRVGGKEYFLNHYIYGYYKRMHEIASNPANSAKPSQMKSLDDVLWCENLTRAIHPLQASAEVDTVFMSQLIQPTGSLSAYVKKGESSIIDETKTLNITTTDDLKTGKELASDKTSYLANVVVTNLQKNISGVELEKVQYLDQALAGELVSTRQLIIRRKVGLQEYFEEAKHNSAIQLHISSFCLPCKIKRGGTVFLEYQPNCKFIPGLGLVSISTICTGDLLIIDRTVDIENFRRLKMAEYKESLLYTDNIKKDVYPYQLSYLWDSKMTLSKNCMYNDF